MARCIVFCFVFAFCVAYSWSSRVKIEKNKYKDILIALPRNVGEVERSKVVRNVQDILTQSSSLLQVATKGRAFFSDVTFLVPHNWDIPEEDDEWGSLSYNSSEFFESGAAWTVDDADVVITNDGQFPYVLHQNGCGRSGLRIIMPKEFVLREGQKSKKFIRLWSEYRYGVFPEGGFRNDEKYPTTYRSPGEEEEKVTQCSDNNFWRSPNSCGENDKGCTDNPVASSLMDQHLPPSATLFCEGDVSLGPKHNPESPSKHNLVCKEEGTWFTVMRSPDFSGGRNAAPKYQRDPTVSFRFVRETVSPHVIIAIEISSRMQHKSRYPLSKAAFSRFVASIVPDGTKLTLFVFGGEESPRLLKNETLLEDKDSRTDFLESQPLPEHTRDSGDVNLHELMDEIFQVIRSTENIRNMPPDIAIVTTVSHVNDTTSAELKQKLLQTESRLHVLLFDEDDEEDTKWTSLYDLCIETGGQLTSLESDPLGNLFRGFGKILHGGSKEKLILQDYLKEDDDVNLTMSFVVDKSLSKDLKVQLSFPYSVKSPLQYTRTFLRTPSGVEVAFKKMELMSAWIADVVKPEIGEYILTTHRLEDAIDPVLVTVSSTPAPDDDPITVRVWAEILFNTHILPPPVQIFAEVRKSWKPVRGAKVTAFVHHPDDAVSELLLLDDGLGDVDITQDDGIYGRYFTNFTSPGFYNVYVKVISGANNAEIMEGPDDSCCGSHFAASGSHTAGIFQREAGPESFYVANYLEDKSDDRYPPCRVTDLKLNNSFDRICFLQWTAVGDDYDAGVAKEYELKVFPDRTLIRTRFNDSGLDVYSEIIETTPEAKYGIRLNHIFEFPANLGGIYYIGIRAIDDSGNAGEPSNTLPVWIPQSSEEDIKCDSEELPQAEQLQGDSAKRLIPVIMICTFIPINALLPLISIIVSMTFLNIA